MADLLSKMNKKSLRFLPAAQVATLRRAQVTGLPRKASMVSLQDPRFHVHFGGGKLGLGLIIPAIVKSQVKFAVVQRSSKDFESLVQGVNLQDKKDSSDKIKSIALKVNEDEIAQVGLVTCLSDIPVDWLEWLKMRRSDDGLPPPSNLTPVGLFVLSEDPDVLDLVYDENAFMSHIATLLLLAFLSLTSLTTSMSSYSWLVVHPASPLASVLD